MKQVKDETYAKYKLRAQHRMFHTFCRSFAESMDPLVAIYFACVGLVVLMIVTLVSLQCHNPHMPTSTT